VRKHPRSAKQQGLLGKTQVAQYDDLALFAEDRQGASNCPAPLKPGLFLPEVKEILLTYQDLEDTGFLMMMGVWQP
jgi:hypothetical protein